MKKKLVTRMFLKLKKMGEKILKLSFNQIILTLITQTLITPTRFTLTRFPPTQQKSKEKINMTWMTLVHLKKSCRGDHRFFELITFFWKYSSIEQITHSGKILVAVNLLSIALRIF